MSAQTAADSGTAPAQRRRKRIHLIFWLPTVIILPPVMVVSLLYFQHVLSLTPWLLSGSIAERPDVREALMSSVIWSLIHVAFIGLWLLAGALWYRKALRTQKG